MRNEKGEEKEKEGKEKKRSQLGRVTTHEYIKY